jgi:hypothetical protein
MEVPAIDAQQTPPSQSALPVQPALAFLPASAAL